MNIRQVVAAVAAAGFGVFCAIPVAAHSLSRDPGYGNQIISGSLANGGHYVVLPNSAVPLSAVELWYAVPSTGYGPVPTTSIARLAAQSVAASASAGGVSLGEYVASIGGTLSIDVFPGSVAVTALVPATAATATVALMTHNYFTAVVTDTGLKRAKIDLATQAILDKFDADTVIRNGLMSSLFTAGPEHYPTLDIHDLNGLDITAVRGFAEQGFRAQRAALVVTGGPSDAVIRAAKAVPIAPPAALPPDLRQSMSALASKPVDLTLKFQQPGAGFAWAGPGIADENAATAMDFFADYLFHPIDGRVTRLLSTATPDVTLNGQFITLHRPGIFVVSISGTGSDAAAKIVRKEISALATPMAPADFARAQNAFIYHLESNLQSPADFAASIGWYATEGRPGYAPGAAGDGGAYFHDAAALTPDSVTAVAREFLTTQPVTVTLQATVQEKSH